MTSSYSDTYFELVSSNTFYSWSQGQLRLNIERSKQYGSLYIAVEKHKFRQGNQPFVTKQYFTLPSIPKLIENLKSALAYAEELEATTTTAKPDQVDGHFSDCLRAIVPSVQAGASATATKFRALTNGSIKGGAGGLDESNSGEYGTATGNNMYKEDANKRGRGRPLGSTSSKKKARTTAGDKVDGSAEASREGHSLSQAACASSSKVFGCLLPSALVDGYDSDTCHE